VIGFGELEASSSLLISLRSKIQALQVSGDKFSPVTRLLKRGMQKSKDRN
jgi:hypothetical protein